MRNTVKKINAAKGKSSQGRLDSFFTSLPSNKQQVKKPEPAAKGKKGAAAAKGGLGAKGAIGKKAPIGKKK